MTHSIVTVAQKPLRDEVRSLTGHCSLRVKVEPCNAPRGSAAASALGTSSVTVAMHLARSKRGRPPVMEVYDHSST